MMQKLFSYAFVCFLMIALNNTTVRAQTKAESGAFQRFVYCYNGELSDSLFLLFDPQMKETLPIDKTESFITTTKAQLGKIENHSFVKKEGILCVYKCDFENGTFAINMAVTKAGQISGLFLKPFVEEKKQRTTTALENFPEDLAKTIYKYAKNFPNNTQLSIAIIEDDKVSYYGIIIENDVMKSTDNKHKIFEIGSVTKVFTSTILADMVIQEKIKLTDNINRYYDFDFNKGIQLNFLELSNHSSGLPRLPSNLNLKKVDPNSPYKDYKKDDLELYLKKKMILGKKEYAYSNTATGLLLHTMSLAENKSFAELYKGIFDKYQMDNSYINRENLKHELVLGRDNDGNTIPNWDFDVLFGAGGILSSTSDLCKFVQAHFDDNNQTLALTRKVTLTVNTKTKVGLGLHVVKLNEKQDVFWHNGGTAGYSSSLSFDTEQKTGVIILSNVSAFSPHNPNIDKLGFELIGSLSE